MATIGIHGVRGSIPVSNVNIFGYGGNTTCVSIVAGDEQVIIDAGTGIRTIGVKDKPIHLLFSHYHHDHVQGLPFFLPLFDKKTEMRFYGPLVTVDGMTKPLDEQIAYVMREPYFPIELKDTASHKTYKVITPGERLDFANFSLETIALHHPGGSLGYIVHSDEGKAALIWDHELGIDATVDDTLKERCEGADVLIQDAQYTTEEYLGIGTMSHREWGHSTIGGVAAFAKQIGVKRVYATHHDPLHDDRFLDGMIEGAQRIYPLIRGAMEGHRIDLKSGEYYRSRTDTL